MSGRSKLGRRELIQLALRHGCRVREGAGHTLVYVPGQTRPVAIHRGAGTSRVLDDQIRAFKRAGLLEEV